MTESIKKPKIALACPSFSGGGAERAMITLANRFVELGYFVDFVVVVDRGPYRNMLSPLATKWVLTDDNAGKAKKALQASIRLYKYLKTTNAKSLMSTIREFNIFVGSIAFLSKRKMPIFFREAASLDISHFRGSILKIFKLHAMRFFYSYCDGVIANSIATKEDLLNFCSLPSSHITVIYNPLNTPQGIEKREKENTKRLIAVGRLVENKNFSDLVRVIPLIKRKYPKVTLEILGEGEERENLQNLIVKLNLKENVRLAGFVDNPYAYYSRADVFVQTSLWEGFGYVLAEAMACGTPVVAYDSKGAMREILADGKFGVLTPVGDLQALADAIVQQIEKPTSSELLFEAIERFDANMISRQYLDAMGVK